MGTGTKVIQVSNIAPQATKDQLSALFSYLGRIEDIRLYPSIRDVAIPVQSRICFIKCAEREMVCVARHLTNVVFIDRALLVIPYLPGDMPDEAPAVDILNSCSVFPGLYQPGEWPVHVQNEVDGIILHTVDPVLAQLGLPPYPCLPATTEAAKVHEIRRTLVLDGLSPETTAEEVEEFAAHAGLVAYVRLGEGNALVEFERQTDVPTALSLHGHTLNGCPVNVNHSTEAIIKPLAKSNEAAVREIEEAMQRVKEAQNVSSSSLDASKHIEGQMSPTHSRSRSRSKRRSSTRHRSRSRRRSRSRSRRRRSRSRGKSSRRERDRPREERDRRRSSKERSSRDDKKKEDTKAKEEPKVKEEPKDAEEESTTSPAEDVKGTGELATKEEVKEEKEVKGEAEEKEKKSSRRSRSPRRRSRSKERRSKRSSSRSRRERRSRSRERARRREERPRSRERRDAKRRDERRSPERKRRREERDERKDKGDRKDREERRDRDDRRDKEERRDRKEKEIKAEAPPTDLASKYDEEDSQHESEDVKAEPEDKPEAGEDMDISE